MSQIRAFRESYQFVAPVTAPAAAASQIKLQFGQKAVQVNVQVENIGETAGSMSFKLQDSADGTTYADVSASIETEIVAKGSFRFTATLREYVAVIASGGVQGEMILDADALPVKLTRI